MLDGSGQGPYLIRRGPMWKAVRASGSLPAVLPPVFTDDGRMLVDGGVVDNIPLRSMKALKTGPNLVVHFGLREMKQRFDVDYANIPGRWGLLRKMLTPSGRRKLPGIPNPISVLQRCLVMHQNPELLPVGPLDLVLTVPPFPGANFMDFDQHFEVFEAAYHWCRARIDELVDKGDPAITAIMATKAETAASSLRQFDELVGAGACIVHGHLNDGVSLLDGEPGLLGGLIRHE